MESEDFTLPHRFLVIPPGFLMDSMDSMWNLWNYVESTWNLWGSVKYTGGVTEMPNIGWEGVWLDPKKKIVTLPKLGLFSGRKAQEACPSILM